MGEKIRYEFIKRNETDKIWIARTIPATKGGALLFSFDKNQVFNFLLDYPHKLTEKQLELFEAQFPYWVKYYRGEI